MEKQTEENLKSKSTWHRLLFIILFAICFNVAEIVLASIAVIQFFSTLFTGEPLAQLQKFGASLSTYLRQLADFLVYAKDDKPFPIGQWPDVRDFRAKEEEDVIVTPVKKKHRAKPKPALKKGDEPAT